MKTKYGNRESKTTVRRNSAGCQLELTFLLIGLAVLISLASPTTAVAADADKSATITVLVFNFREIPAKTLVKAENEAAGILERAGLHAIWRDCPTTNEPCVKGPGRVFILALNKGPIQYEFADTVSGYAMLPEHIAVVYYDYLPRGPGGRGDKDSAAMILGCVIAHELGHLLLGAHGHSISGIMQAGWGVEQTQLALMSRLSFLPDEVKRIHADAAAPETKNNSAYALTAH
jgi:hypothetical protein